MPTFGALAEPPDPERNPRGTSDDGDIENFATFNWSADGMEEGRIHDVADILDTCNRWNALLYQEGPFAD
eukprot:7715004-Pyramimonas_sp.AAC.1